MTYFRREGLNLRAHNSRNEGPDPQQLSYDNIANQLHQFILKPFSAVTNITNWIRSVKEKSIVITTLHKILTSCA
jgi:hypothetical protein